MSGGYALENTNAYCVPEFIPFPDLGFGFLAELRTKNFIDMLDELVSREIRRLQ